MEEMRHYGAERLQAFCTAALGAVDIPEDGARIAARCLVSANLHGVDTHGVARLPTYLRRIAQGAIKAGAEPAVVGGTGAVAVIDGRDGLGPIVAHAAMAEAIDRARKHGVSYVTARSSSHFSYAAYWSEQAAAEGLIGICSSGGEPTVAPWGGTQAFFTNSPLAIAAPTSNDPIVVDLATSVSSRGNILLARMLGQPIPPDWAIDRDGQATTDPVAALAGSVLPIAGAKGYALIVGLEILNSVLAGGTMAPDVGSQAAQDGRPAGVSHFFIALDPSSLMDRAEYLARIDTLAARTRSAPPSDPSHPIRLPGDRRRQLARKRRATGIPLPLKLVDELISAAEQYAPAAKGYL